MSSRVTALVVFAVGLLSAIGCSGTSFRVIKDADADMKATGFRYYEASAYMLVYSDGKGGLTSKLIYLPDQTKLRSVRPWEFLAKSTTNLSFSNGVLTETTLEGDSTALPKAVIEAAKTAAIAAAGGIGLRTGGPGGFAVPTPYLFKILIKGDLVSLLAAPGTMPDGSTEIRVTPGFAGKE